MLLYHWTRLDAGVMSVYKRAGLIPYTTATDPSLGMTSLFCSSTAVVSYQKWGPACQSFFWYNNDQDLKTPFPMTQLSFPATDTEDISGF